MTKQNIAVLVCEPMAAEGIELLKDQPNLSVDVVLNLSPSDLLKKIGDYDALLVRSQTKVNRDVIMAGKRLSLIGRAGVGIDNIEIAVAKECGIAVINTPSGNSISAAELAFGLMMCLARKIPHAHAHMREGLFERKKFQGVELYKKTLGLIGFGNVGQTLASRAKAFEMRVAAYDPWAKEQVFLEHGVENWTLDKVLLESDFLSLHCALTDQTKNLINDATIKKMKQGIRLINTARGELIDDQALIRGIDAGQISCAALDVFRKEPPDTSDPLLKHPKILLTPHLGASTEEAQLRVSTLLAEQTIAFFNGSKTLTRVV